MRSESVKTERDEMPMCQRLWVDFVFEELVLRAGEATGDEMVEAHQFRATSAAAAAADLSRSLLVFPRFSESVPACNTCVWASGVERKSCVQGRVAQAAR